MLGALEVDREAGTAQAGPELAFIFSPLLAPRRQDQHWCCGGLHNRIRHISVVNVEDSAHLKATISLDSQGCGQATHRVTCNCDLASVQLACERSAWCSIQPLQLTCEESQVI